jgi:biopolymer transport protein ExbB
MKHPTVLPLRPLLILLALGLTASVGYGQAGGDPVVETTETSLLSMIAAGGWAMWPLGFLSVAAFTLICYNFYALRSKVFFDDKAEAELKDAIKRLDLAEAQKICGESDQPVFRIFNHGLDSMRGESIDLQIFKEQIETSAPKELAGPFVIVNYLSVIASIAPMLGLLGTVSGMVKAFDAIATVGMGQPDVLAGNISEALITTATGMLIGIPAMFFFFHFKNVYGKIIADVTMRVGSVQAELVYSLRAEA